MKEVTYIEVGLVYQSFASTFELDASQPTTISQFVNGGWSPLRKTWAIRHDYMPWVNGVETDESYVLQDGDVVEYLKPTASFVPQREVPSPRPQGVVAKVKEFFSGIAAFIAIANTIGEPARWRRNLPWNRNKRCS